jgi:predicted HD superfamily hydrolase involved in NAD metabolism
MEISEIRRIVGGRLSAKRARHTEAVAALAGELAGEIGEDPRKAELAGWLHDCAKHMSIEEQLAFAAKNGIALSADDHVSLGMIHARLGAFLAATEFGVRDEDVLTAIRFHATGRAGMSRFEKLVMAADYLEPNRPFDFRERVLARVRADFEAGMLEVVKSRLLAVIAKGRPVHPDSVAFYDEQLVIVSGRGRRKAATLPGEEAR